MHIVFNVSIYMSQKIRFYYYLAFKSKVIGNFLGQFEACEKSKGSEIDIENIFLVNKFFSTGIFDFSNLSYTHYGLIRNGGNFRLVPFLIFLKFLHGLCFLTFQFYTVTVS